MKLYLTQIDPPPDAILQRLRRRGWQPVHHPFRKVHFREAVGMDDLGAYAAIAITSKNAARWFLNQSLAKPWPPFAIVGEATAAVLAEMTARVLAKPAQNADELALTIRHHLAAPAPILFLCGARVSPRLAQSLVDYPLSMRVVYETRRLEGKIHQISAAGMVYFQAPSTVEDFVTCQDFQPAKIAAIGPTTRAALRRRGWRVDFQPSRPELEVFANELPTPESLAGLGTA